MKNTKHTYWIEILFDNGGGTLLVAEVNGVDYTHHFDDASQAAESVLAIIGGDDTRDWEGNEPACRQIRHNNDGNGTFTVSLSSDDDAFCAWPDEWLWGRNSEAFYDYIRAHNDAWPLQYVVIDETINGDTDQMRYATAAAAADAADYLWQHTTARERKTRRITAGRLTDPLNDLDGGLDEILADFGPA